MAHIVVEVGAAFSIFPVGGMLISPAEYTLWIELRMGRFVGKTTTVAQAFRAVLVG